MDIKEIITKLIEEGARNHRSPVGRLISDLEDRVSRRDGGQSNAVEYLVIQIGGSDNEAAVFDFGSAHYNFDIRDHIPRDEHTRLIDRINQTKSGRKLSDATYSHDVLENILREETTLDLGNFRLLPRHGTTRESLNDLLNKIACNGRVALPIPNWHFWDLEGEQNYVFNIFNGESADRLVDEFKRVAKSSDVLLLVSPANPMMYEIDENVARELNRIANENRVKVVINDVMRGVQPIGQRDTIARYFDKPYVVEGMSKRFGDYPIGNVSYLLVPNSDRTINNNGVSEEWCICGEILRVAYSQASKAAIEELCYRNSDFDAALQAKVPGIRIIRPSSSNIISLVELPEGFPYTANQFALLLQPRGIDIFPVEKYYPDCHVIGNSNPNHRRFRVTVGRMNCERIRNGAGYLGDAINEMAGRY